MGKAYHVKCSECTYEQTFYLGVGQSDEGLGEQVLQNLNDGFYGEAGREFAIRAGEGTLTFERKLYRCLKCGNLGVRVKMRLIAADLSFSQPYFCSQCGKLLGQVKPSDIKKQLCPICGKPIQVVSISDWDSAPPDGQF